MRRLFQLHQLNAHPLFFFTYLYRTFYQQIGIKFEEETSEYIYIYLFICVSLLAFSIMN